MLGTGPDMIKAASQESIRNFVRYEVQQVLILYLGDTQLNQAHGFLQNKIECHFDLG